MRSVFPQAEVVARCVDSYPIKVTVAADMPDGGRTVYVWSGRQQHLFRKNGDQRAQSIEAIRAGLVKLKGDFQVE